MNKAELISAVAETTGTSKAVAEATIATVIGTIVEAAKADGSCNVPGIGKLEVVATKATEGGVTKPVPGNKEGKTYVTEAKPAGRKFKLKVLKDGTDSLA